MQLQQFPPAPAPDVFPSCLYMYGHGEDAAIPDTSLAVWEAEIEGVLAECARRSGGAYEQQAASNRLSP